jgi:hypothetical protein
VSIVARCSICHTRIEQSDEVTQCDLCTQGYHATCWTELGGCGTYGCARAAVASKAPPPTVVGAGWGDTKQCPECDESIASSLLVCRCRARFPWADAMTRGEYREWKAEQDEISTSKKLLVGLFIGSLIGVTAPVCGPISGIYTYRHRKLLASENGTYVALGIGSTALGTAYTLIIALLALGL